MWIDLGVDRSKSTRVDMGIRSRVGSILLGAVDPLVEFEMTTDFSLALLQVDLNRLKSPNNSQCWPKQHRKPLPSIYCTVHHTFLHVCRVFISRLRV